MTAPKMLVPFMMHRKYPLILLFGYATFAYISSTVLAWLTLECAQLYVLM
jgi:hypothetical protein